MTILKNFLVSKAAIVFNMVCLIFIPQASLTLQVSDFFTLISHQNRRQRFLELVTKLLVT